MKSLQIVWIAFFISAPCWAFEDQPDSDRTPAAIKSTTQIQQPWLPADYEDGSLRISTQDVALDLDLNDYLSWHLSLSVSF